MSTQPTQPFRGRSTGRIATIPTRLDPNSGQRVVRWKDIQQCFADVQYIKQGPNTVPFLTDKNLDDLVPLRIAFHPGIVLDVVSQGDIQSENYMAFSGSTASFDSVLTSGSTLTSGSRVSNANNQVARPGPGIEEYFTTLLMAAAAASGRSYTTRPASPVQEVPITDTDQSQPPSTEGNSSESADQQGRIRQLEEQIGQVQGNINSQIEEILQGLEKIDQRSITTQQKLTDHVEDILHIARKTRLQKQRLDDILKEMKTTNQQTQETKEAQEETQQQVALILRKMYMMDQEMKQFQTQVQESQLRHEKLLQQIAKDKTAQQDPSSPENQSQGSQQASGAGPAKKDGSVKPNILDDPVKKDEPKRELPRPQRRSPVSGSSQASGSSSAGGSSQASESSQAANKGKGRKSEVESDSDSDSSSEDSSDDDEETKEAKRKAKGKDKKVEGENKAEGEGENKKERFKGMRVILPGGTVVNIKDREKEGLIFLRCKDHAHILITKSE
ncbi:hypothetical protein B0O80DRAFT_127276 [Mortierella sp. GBAus27b]|nr:hypothetical protein BGX31_001906 [Mortierella sp. GBA43]KAI8350813.1 hypothetical protein B0O80DRAFT_127276 [Mortierella sp. GBAus27b]